MAQPDPMDRPWVILVVEDEVLIRLSIAADLRALGFAVLEASNAAAAIARLRSPAYQIDAVFSDVRMASLTDGLDLAAWLKQHRCNIPVLLTSGNAFAAQASEIDVPFIAKPYDSADVVRKLTSLLEQRST